MRLVIAIVIVLAGIVGGGAVGLALRTSGSSGGEAAAPEPEATETPAAGAASPLDEAVFIKLSRQLIVPVVRDGRTVSLVLFDLAVDVAPEHRDAAFAREPRLRDAFLRALFEMSNTGAFDHDYIEDRVMAELRETLLDRARLHLGAAARDVLVLDVLRQEQ